MPSACCWSVPSSTGCSIPMHRTGRFPSSAPALVMSLQQIVPSHFHNAWTIVAFALVASTLLKGIFDYCGTYLVNYAGFGMITDLRDDLYDAILRRSVSFFPTTRHRHDCLHADQRHRASAVCHVVGAGGVPAAVLHFDLYCLRGGCAGRQAGLGPGAVCSRGAGVGTQDRPPGAADHAPRSGQAGRDPEHSARDHHRETALSKLSTWSFGR